MALALYHWRTTLGGLLSAVGTVLSHVPEPTCLILGPVLASLGLVLLGTTAADSRAAFGP